MEKFKDSVVLLLIGVDVDEQNLFKQYDKTFTGRLKKIYKVK